MRTMLLMLLSVLLLTPLGAVPATGIVVTPGGKPAAAALVVLRYPENEWPRHAITDFGGKFSLHLSPRLISSDAAGTSAMAYLPGYGIAWCNLKQGNNRISLLRAQTVKGRVVDESGKPVLGAVVRLECLFPQKGSYVYLPDELKAHFQTTTDKDGGWVITDLPAIGTASFILDDPRYLSRSEFTKTRVYGTLALPHPTTSTMVASPAGRISGRIVTSNGTPAPAGTMVSLSIDVMDSPHWSGVTTEKAVTDADGKYAFGGLMGGTSSITLATGTGVSITPILKNMHVNAGREITIPDISLSQGGIISGRVLFKKTKEPIPGVNISVATVTTTTDRRVQEDTDLNGTFAINMLPGVYTI